MSEKNLHGEKGRFRLLHPVTLTRAEFDALRSAADGQELLEPELEALRSIVDRAEVHRLRSITSSKNAAHA